MTSFPFPTKPVVDSSNGWEDLNLAVANTMYQFTAAKYQSTSPACAILQNKSATVAVELRFDAPGVAWAANNQAYNLPANGFICLPSIEDIQNLRLIARTNNTRVGIAYRRIND